MRIASHYRIGHIVDPDCNSRSLAIYLLATALNNGLAEPQVRYLDHKLDKPKVIDGSNIALLHARHFNYPESATGYLDQVLQYFQTRKY